MTEEKTDGEKLDELRKIWKQVTVSIQDFATVAKQMGLSNNQLGIVCYDEAQETGETMPQAIDRIVKQEMELLVKQDMELLAQAKVSRQTKWKISKLPHGEWEKAIERASNRHTPCKMLLRLINSREANAEFLGEEVQGGFLDMVILSALCSVFDKGKKTISTRELWEMLHNSKDWRKENDKDGWTYLLSKSIDRLNQYANSNNWLYALQGDCIIINGLPAIWQEASKAKHIIAIPQNLIGGKSHLNWLAKIYVARRVILAENDKNKMTPAISLKALTFQTGERISSNTIHGYFEWLATEQKITSYLQDKEKVDWICGKTLEQAHKSITGGEN